MQRIIESPIGPIFARASERGIAELRLTSCQARSDALPEPSPRNADSKPTSGPEAGSRAAERWLSTLQRELDAYFSAGRQELAVAIDVHGTPFQQRVWDVVRTIPFGETRTYGEIAAMAGAPRSARAVGTANGRNRVSLLVPCHRVVGAGGALTGYAWGVDKKRWLLEHEAAPARARSAIVC